MKYIKMKYINLILIITFAITLLSGCDNNTGNSISVTNEDRSPMLLRVRLYMPAESFRR